MRFGEIQTGQDRIVTQGAVSAQSNGHEPDVRGVQGQNSGVKFEV